MENDDSLDRGDTTEGGEKWSDSSYILEEK